MKATSLPRTALIGAGAIVITALLAIALPALAAAPKKNGVYRGTVAGNAGQPVGLYVSKTGKAFSYPSGATVLVTCSDGGRLRVSPNPVGGVKIRNGKFSFTGKDKEGGPRPNISKMTGKFTDRGKKVSGTISYEGADDQRTCKTGTLTYTAKLKLVAR